LAHEAEVYVDTLAGQASTSTGNRAALAHEAEVYVDTLAARARAAR
jgi:hypothetical protein